MPTFDYACEVCGRAGRDWRVDKPPRFCSRACHSKGVAGRSLKPGRFPIGKDLHVAIRLVYQTMTGNGEVRELAKRVGYPGWKITRYARGQGWIARQTRGPDWSDEETAILERVAYLSPERIQARLKTAG